MCSFKYELHLHKKLYLKVHTRHYFHAEGFFFQSEIYLCDICVPNIKRELNFFFNFGTQYNKLYNYNYSIIII